MTLKPKIDQTVIKDMEINLDDLDMSLMPELSESAEVLTDMLPEKDKSY